METMNLKAADVIVFPDEESDSWVEIVRIKEVGTYVSKSGNSCLKLQCLRGNGQTVYRYVPFTGRNKDNISNARQVLEVLRATPIPTLPWLASGATLPVQSIIDVLRGQPARCCFRMRSWNGREPQPEITRFLPRPRLAVDLEENDNDESRTTTTDND